MKKERKMWAISLIAFWWFSPNQIDAQPDTVRSEQLTGIVVTATKFAKNVNETAKVLTIIDEAQLSRSSGKDLSQLLNEQTGLVINGANSNPGKDKSVFLRGAKSDYTLILLDGIPLNDPAAIGGGAYDLRLIPIDQIERIEILKGSQSTLYGSDAIAGVINIFTKRKGEKSIGGSGNLGYGSYNTLRGSAALTGSTKNLNYHVGYTRYQTDGISEAKDSTGNNNFDKDGYEQNALQLNAEIKIAKSLSINPFLRYNNFRGLYDAGGFTDSRENQYTSNLLNTGLSAVYSLAKGSLNFLYAYDRTDRTFDDDYGLAKFKGRFTHMELFWNNDLTKHFQILTGVSSQAINMQDTATTEKNPTMNLTSPYVSIFLRNLQGFSAEVGGRYNHHSEFGNVFTYSFNPAYMINNSIKLFANVSTGFKSPNLTQLYGPFGGNPLLLPEKSRSLEGGVQLISNSKKTDIRVTAFQREIDDLIFYSTDPITFTSSYINLNKQRDQGLEIELNAPITSSLLLRTFYAYVDGEVTSRSGTKDSSYNNLFRRPKHSFGINLAYQATKKLFISANLKTFSQRSDLYFNLSTFVNENVTLDSYALVDVYVEYALWNSNMKIWLDARNLLNQDYMEVVGYNTQQLNFTTGLNFRF